MIKRKNIIRIVEGVFFVLLFFVCAFLFKKNDEFERANNLERNLRVISSELWHSDLSTLESYLPVIVEQEKYQKLVIYDEDKKELISVDGSGETVSFLRYISWLSSYLRSFCGYVEVHEIIYKKSEKFEEHIGFLEIYRCEYNYYGYFFIFIFCLVLCFISESVHYMLRANRRLQEQHQSLENTLEKLHEVQEQLVENEKQASLGRLVCGVAHEINTPLGIIINYTTYMQDNLKKLVEDYRQGIFKKSSFEKFCSLAEEALQGSFDAAKRAADLVQRFKKTAVHNRVEEPQRFELNQYVTNIVDHFKPLYKNTPHRIFFMEEPEKIWVTSYPEALMQILSNLISNSFQHGFDSMDGEGKISIELSLIEKDLVQITYSDNGKGMAEEHQENLFDPFYTVDKNSGGLGLGMNICYNLIANSLGGNIECRSLEQGLEFIVTIPCDVTKD